MVNKYSVCEVEVKDGVEKIDTWSQELNEKQTDLYHYILSSTEEKYYAIFHRATDTGMRFLWGPKSPTLGSGNFAFNIKNNTIYQQKSIPSYYQMRSKESLAEALVSTRDGDWEIYKRVYSLSEKIEQTKNKYEVDYLLREHFKGSKYEKELDGLVISEVLFKCKSFVHETKNNKLMAHYYLRYSEYAIGGYIAMVTALEYHKTLTYQSSKYETLLQNLTEEEWNILVERNLLTFWFENVIKIYELALLKVQSFLPKN